jgi:hypothetical protein
MNERIKELAEQAGITTNLDTNFFEKDPNKWVDYYSEKFAELIVGECASIADEPTSQPFNSYGKKIKQHFGVE